MTKRFAVAIALLSALTLAGCGTSEDFYTAPDTTPPLAPVMLGASYNGGMLNVWWEPNTEADLWGYHAYVSNGEAIQSVNSDPYELSFMSIPTEGAGWHVFVTAVDRAGNESGPSDSMSPSLSNTNEPIVHQPRNPPAFD